ncbi:DUF3991 and toprim domain-containing protein [Dysosmobacter welbionis]|jgi:hypothetical protein|uniref:DUF3991 and toprim domain-containing protein n=1 Tax=Dysosmobacter welbionis TaxID=2093857 RepID=UPI003A90BFEA
MNEYIPFTDEQKRRANAMDLEDYLLRRGERLLPSGREKRLASDRSITIRGSEWFDHEAQQGGRAIDFVRMHDGCSFQEAVTKLLNGEQGQMFQQTEERKAAPPKIFVLPPAHHSMRRVYAYLMQQRHIDRDIITYFARSGTLYEDAEYHNAVFVGTDEHGVARHAQKRSTNSQGKAFKLNVEGSDARYSFHHLGMDGELYVFEAPIDLLSYLTMNPEDWQRHSYVACCGTSYEPVRWMLTQMASPEAVYLCLDSDQTGQRACERMAELIHTEFCIPTQQLTPELKDWNEDLCALQDIPNRGPEMRMG